VILLDTNVLSELMRREPDPTVITWLDAQSSQQVYVSAITRAEIELGIALLPDGRRKQGLQMAATRMFAEFPGRCLAFDEKAATKYAGLVAARTHAGHPISVEDGQIAAIALANELSLATRNVADFSGIDGLSLVDPFTAAA
jgi:predicted nucleic acid-binding protein